LEKNLFTWLATPKNIADIATHFDWQFGTTKKYCEILSYLGLVSMQGEAVLNTKEANNLLNRNSESNIVACLLELSKWCLDPLSELPLVLRDGPVPPERSTDSESLWREILTCGANLVFADSGKKVTDYLSSLPGTENFRRMLDFGGGHGGYALCAAEAMPSLEVDVLDFPDVLQVAEHFRKKSAASSRVHLLPANFVTDAIPSGYDLVLASATLNFTLPNGNTRQVMDKIHAALKPGGYCISIHDGPADGGLVPEWPFECHVCDLVTGRPMAMPEGLIAETMLASGFVHVRTEYLRLNGSIMTVDVARKDACVHLS
jgi:hypothetical protein